MSLPKFRPGFFCKQCDTPLLYTQTWPAIIKNGHGKFCSRKCCELWRAENLTGDKSAAWRGGSVECKCEFCSGSFLANKSKADNRNTARFCSVKCKGLWQARDIIGEKAPGWKGGKTERLCEVCNCNFLAWQFEIDRGYARFCSQACYGKWYSEERAGENNFLWRGGYSLYPSEFNGAFKLNIRERDLFVCAICDTGNSKDVHHIDYVKENTVQENCITLCRSCHMSTNANRGDWQVYLTKIMQNRGFADYKVSFPGVELHWVEEK